MCVSTTENERCFAIKVDMHKRSVNLSIQCLLLVIMFYDLVGGSELNEVILKVKKLRSRDERRQNTFSYR